MTDMEKEREEFEKWFRKESSVSFERTEVYGGEYVSDLVAHSWIAWQERAAKDEKRVNQLEDEIERLKTPSDGEIYAAPSAVATFKENQMLKDLIKDLKNEIDNLKSSQMNEEMAMEILQIESDNNAGFCEIKNLGLMLVDNYQVAVSKANSDSFTLEYLKALIWFMENKK